MGCRTWRHSKRPTNSDDREGQECQTATLTIRGTLYSFTFFLRLTIFQHEIYVYDKTFLSGASKRDTITFDEPNLPSIPEFPSTLGDENKLSAWQELFMNRRAWALELTDSVRSGIDDVERTLGQAEVFHKCTEVALENLRSHFVGLQQSADRTLTWAQESLAEHADMLQEWKESANTLSELPVREDIARLLKVTDSSARDTATSGTMLGILDSGSLENAAQALSQGSTTFQHDVEHLKGLIENVSHDTTAVISMAKIEWPDIHTDGLLAETEALAKQINKDYQDVLQSHDDQKSISAVSRRAVPHTQNILPTLQEIGTEVQVMVQNAAEMRQKTALNCKQALSRISEIQSQFGSLHSSISGLKVEDECQLGLDTLEKVFRLPVAYGSTLVEAARRSEWNDKMRTDFESLRDDIAQHKDDEIRRRRKWATSLNGFLLDDASSTEALIDLNFSTPANKWPYVSREEIFTYVEDLRALGIEEAVQKVSQLLRELDGAAKSRRTRQTAFKNGSVYDLGQSILRNGDQVRTLQDDKLRLEDKLRSSDSRVRKLEDLLHRQSQLSRPPSGIFTPTTELERQSSFSGQSPGKPPNNESRRSSLSLRRLSNQTLDEKAMVQRIVNLEAQINKLQEEAHAERRSSTESRDKMNEAESVKRDLMANFEAQRQEFEDERQLLEDENHKLKVRLEEVEDELDRVLGSRDHQRLTQDQNISSLRSELEKLRKTAEQDYEQQKQSKDNVLRDLNVQRDRSLSLERQLQHLREERSNLQTQTMSLAGQLRTIEDERQEYLISLQSAHANLSPSGSAPDEFRRLVSALEIVSEGAAIHARGLDDALQLATAESKSQQDSIISLEAKIARLEGALEHANRQNSNVQEELGQERSKLTAIRSELGNEQTELRKLRDKFAAGETGSDALKNRLAEEERRVAELVELKGKNEAQTEALKQEITALTKKVNEVNGTEKELRTQINARAKKARDLSQRLFQHNDRMIRMLESFGYFIIRQDDTLVVQRASKVNASTILNSDGGTAMKRTVSGSVPTAHYTDPADLETLYWTTDHDAETEEKKYESFIKAISRLDLDSTIETVIKRYKDVETLAKKYQKDSRGYRERSHRLQSEAHDKIAYRSFKEGDLALFLPTRNQATRPWAAFNVGAPHYFLREQDAHRLQSRDWLLARITKVEERVVDLSRSLTTNATRNTDGSDEASTRSVDDENPFELSDGLRWYMIDAVEEKPGAPSTPGLGKSTVAASVVDVKGYMGRKSLNGRELVSGTGSTLNVAKTLHKSLDSRRSSEASRKSGGIASLRQQGSGNSGIQAAATAAVTGTGTEGEAEGQMASASTTTPSVKPSEADVKANATGNQAREDAHVFEVVRSDLLLGP